MPSHVRPLADHPQLEIITTQVSGVKEDRVTEYRVYNYKRWRNGTIVRGDGFGWVDVLWLAGLVVGWTWLRWDLETLDNLLKHLIMVCLEAHCRLLSRAWLTRYSPKTQSG
jgi:hypothetical protein